MMITLILASTLLGMPAPPLKSGPDDPTIRLWLSADGRYRPGDRAKVQVQTRDDGYLIVLHVGPDHRVRVLFPLDPGDDNFVRGGKRYEIRGRGGRETFTVTGRSARGTVYAAVSRERFRLDRYAAGGQWDLAALDSVRTTGDAEADLNAFVRGIAQGGFDYDLLGYGTSRRAYAYVPYYGYGYGYPFYPPFASGLYFGFGFRYGYRPFGFGFRRFGRFP
jgi:uncharacterized protein DUF4384